MRLLGGQGRGYQSLGLMERTGQTGEEQGAELETIEPVDCCISSASCDPLVVADFNQVPVCSSWEGNVDGEWS